MSIFKDTFIPEVQFQLDARQNSLKKRDVTSIKYLNSRNAWIKMSSSVNVNGKSELANSYQLKGGILKSDGGLKSGVGGTDNAYSNISPNIFLSSDERKHQRGLRPMPGINSIDIRSKSAYGSLREVVVKFQCWDIKQLEDLELLYMRPGYTVLIEWGWLPYLNLDEEGVFKNIEYNIETFDIIKQTPTKEDIWKELFNKSKTTGGNYDAMFGYVKNYSWSAREDGGYDCSTTIISIGEILESLKINYSTSNLSLGGNKNQGLIFQNLTSSTINKYKKNILAGLFAELYEKCYVFNKKVDINGIDETLQGNLPYDLKFFINKSEITLQESDEDKLVGEQAKSIQVYITLKSLIDLLNDKIILKDKKSQKPMVKLSTYERTYDKKIILDKDLLCLAHPIQISVDPSICLLGNSIWTKIKKPTTAPQKISPLDLATNVSNKYSKQIKTIIDAVEGGNNNENIKSIVDTIRLISTGSTPITNLQILNREFQLKNISQTSATLNDTNQKRDNKGRYYTSYTLKKYTLFEYIDKLFPNRASTITIDYALGIELNTKKEEIIRRRNAIQKDEWKEFEDIADQINRNSIENIDIINKAFEGTGYLKTIESIYPYFYEENPDHLLGKIGNILINLQFLYSLSLDNNLESQDKKEKQEINIYDFIKSVLSSVSNVTGNVNNFDIHIDPTDSIARIIDINYVDENTKEDVFRNAFELQIQNLSSTVRSYKLESQIFQEQSTMVSIGAQVQGGALDIDSNTMNGFNKGITDRIIPIKIDPNTLQLEKEEEIRNIELKKVSESLKQIFLFFGNQTKVYFWQTPSLSYDTNSSSQYANALRDLISAFRSLTNDKNKYNAIIPTKLSITMDGIGGLVIGHIFKIPDNLLPKGYKGGGLGSKLGHIVTGIGHSISNNDWVTNIDAQTIILDDPTPGIDGEKFSYQDYVNLINQSTISLAEGQPSITSEDINISITTTPWSAAFISYVVVTSGLNFPSDSSHTGYAQKLRTNNYGFQLLNPSITKVQVGDIIIQNRENNSMKFNTNPWSGASHGDIITNITNNIAEGIGGNVSQSVSKSSFNLNNGKLISNNIFVIIRPPSQNIQILINNALKEYNLWNSNNWEETSPPAYTTITKYYKTVGIKI
jgi:hypothetical protein